MTEKNDAAGRRRRRLALRLLVRALKIAKDVQAIEDLKEQLRAIALETGAGFTEQVEGKGEVEVKGEVKSRFKGRVPLLAPEAFLALPEAEQKKLEAAGLVAWENEYTQARKPSVTVRV